MRDARPKRTWFEKADQDLEMARQILAENPENPKILKIQIQTITAIRRPKWEMKRKTVVLITNHQTSVSKKTAFAYLLSRGDADL